MKIDKKVLIASASVVIIGTALTLATLYSEGKINRVTNGWPWPFGPGGCVLEPSDSESCKQLADNCNYSSCVADSAITGLFGGCSGLMCHCETKSGAWVEDSITIHELDGNNIECNRVTEVIVAPPTTNTVQEM